MKKIGCVVWLVVVISLFSSCDPVSYQYDLNDLKTTVVRVELIYYDSPNPKRFWSWALDHTDDLVPFDLTKVELYETLDELLIDDFLTDLAEIHILYEYYLYDSPEGVCIRIVNADATFDIIGPSYIGRFSEDGTVLNYVGCFESFYPFKDLIRTYFNYELK